MPIRAHDLADDNATLELRCRQCGRKVQRSGPTLVRDFGREAAVFDLVARMRCKQCGMPPDAIIVLDALEARREEFRRNARPHSR